MDALRLVAVHGQPIVPMTAAACSSSLPAHSTSTLKQYTRQQVHAESGHPTPLLIIIGDLVYDVSEFSSEHPGGAEALEAYSGRDATEAFRSIGHSKAAITRMQKFVVGELVARDRA